MSTELPTTPGSVVQADSLLMLTRFGNWVSDGVFTVSIEDLAAEDFTVLWDAGQASVTPTPPRLEMMTYRDGIGRPHPRQSLCDKTGCVPYTPTAEAPDAS